MTRFLAPLLAVALVAVSSPAFAASAVGLWVTIDDETKKPRSHVKITDEGGVVTGKIAKLLNPSRPNPTCDKCPDEKKGKPIMGIEFIWGLKQKSGKDKPTWEGGKIMDPENGKVYDAKIWLENDNTLKVRGSFLFIGRTQTWYRLDPETGERVSK
ncbi:MAG: DUF2147 domain-containing protein [Myxococcota bacterium]